MPPLEATVEQDRSQEKPKRVYGIPFSPEAAKAAVEKRERMKAGLEEPTEPVPAQVDDPLMPPLLRDLRLIYAGHKAISKGQKELDKLRRADSGAFLSMLASQERQYKGPVAQEVEEAKSVPVEALPEDEGSERALKCLDDWLKEYGNGIGTG